MQVGRSGERRVGVFKVRVPLDKVRWFRKHFVRVPLLPIPTHVEVYRIDSRYCGREAIPYSTSEEQRWTAAEQAYRDTARLADDDVCRAHLGLRARLTLDRSWWWEPPPPSPWPWWQRRRATRSEKAQRAFVAVLERAAEEYRPVRAEIERRLEEIRREIAEEDARRRVAAEAARRDEERRRRVRREMAARRVWVCVDGADEDAVVVYRADVPPDRVPDAGQRHSEPLTVAELEDVLREAQEAGRSRVEWDPRACAAVEDDCREQDAHVAFATWWDSVTGYRWRTRTTATGACTVHVSAYPSSLGVGLEGTGLSDGGGSGGYSGGHSFGTSF
jgi:hypothetical protein